MRFEESEGRVEMSAAECCSPYHAIVSLASVESISRGQYIDADWCRELMWHPLRVGIGLPSPWIRLESEDDCAYISCFRSLGGREGEEVRSDSIYRSEEERDVHHL